MNPPVTIVIPTWNGLDLLRRFLPSVISAARAYAAEGETASEILIVDDGSGDDTVRWLEGQGFTRKHSSARSEETRSGAPGDAAPEPLKLGIIASEVNRGFGSTCNRGFEEADYDLVFLLNNDVEVSRDAIRPLVENFRDPAVFAAHCRVFEFESGRECGTGKIGGFSRGFIRVHKSYAFISDLARSGFEAAAPLYSMFAGGGSAMFDRRKFLDIGGFEELLSPFYWEDVELSYRAWKRGFIVLYEPRSRTRHRISSTIKRLDRARVRRIEQRNRLIFHWINLHDRRLLAAHVLRALLLALASPLLLRPAFSFSCLDAVRSIREIRKRRKAEQIASTRTDREIFERFARMRGRPDIFIYDRLEELAGFEESRRVREREKREGIRNG
ncbi:MAG TPA: glycosyltransferase [Blastocatellia bacterium]|jgi:GT2 family glycosyltransferase|nr:glycosyltransferase [Blastocatellia bacterium]